jgi:hypothetical protein
MVQPANRAEEVLQLLAKMDRDATRNDFEEADLWQEVDQGQYYYAAGAQTLKELVQLRGHRLSPREIAYRINVSRKTKKIGATLEQKLKAKISKLKAICTLDPDLEYTDPETGKTQKVADIMMTLVIDAGYQSLEYIEDQVKKYKGATEGEDSVLEWFNLPSFKSRNEFYKETIDVAKQLSGDTVGADKQAQDI